MAVTIYDIAKRSGLSKSTVAGVLADSPGFSVQTRRQVCQLAEKMGYRPNLLGKALVGGKTMSIGLVVGSTDPVMMAAVQAIERLAGEGGRRVFVIFGENEDAGVARAVRDLLDRRTDGLIVYGTKPPGPQLQTALDPAIAPVVYMREAPPDTQAVVRIERDQALRELASHLRQWGHRRIMHLRTRLCPGPIPPTLLAYERSFAAAGVEFVHGGPWLMRPRAMRAADWIEEAYHVVHDRITAGDVPTAITVADDELAIAVIAAVRAAGLRVPEDISVAGKDGLPIGRLNLPSVTTLEEPSVEPAQAAYAMLNKLIADPTAPQESPIYQARLVLRDSTGPARH